MKQKKNAVNETTVIQEEEILESEQRIIDEYCQAKSTDKPFRLLFKLYRGHYGKIFAAFLFRCITSLDSVILPISIAGIIDAAVAREDNYKAVIIGYFILSAVMVLITVPAGILYTKARSVAMRSVEAGIRGAIVRKLQQLTIKFKSEMLSGRIQSKIVRDADSVYTFSQQFLLNAFQISITLTYSIVVMIYKGCWPVLAFFTLSVPAAALIRHAFKPSVNKANMEFRRSMETTTSKVVDSVEMLEIARAHAAEDTEISEMTNQFTDSANTGYHLDMLQGIFGNVSGLTMRFFDLSCLLFCIILMLNDKITIGDVTLYRSFFSTLVSLVSSFLNLIPIIEKGLDSIVSIGEILSSNEIEHTEKKKVIKNFKGEYVFNNVRFQYDENKEVLKGLDLTVHAGETIAIVGESGAGKSTILNLVTGFYLPSSGKFTIDGVDINQLNLHEYRKNIAVVPQSSVLFTGTVRENITYGNKKVSERKINEVINAACLTKVIADLPEGLDTPVGEGGGNFSGGQRQRMCIARALIRDPKVIILDEATSALDTVSEKEIQKAIENLCHDRTTFIVAHRLSTVKNADKIAVMDDGKCIEYGTYDELIAKKGAFYQFRNLQV